MMPAPLIDRESEAYDKATAQGLIFHDDTYITQEDQGLFFRGTFSDKTGKRKHYAYQIDSLLTTQDVAKHLLPVYKSWQILET